MKTVMKERNVTAWHARVTFAATGHNETMIMDALERLESYGAAGSLGDLGGSIEMGIDMAGTPAQVAVKAEQLASEALGESATVTGVSVMPESEFIAELEKPELPAVVGYSEIAEMAGVSRQRAHQLAHSSDFPPPVIETRQGALMRKSAVEAWLRRRNTRPGRPAKASSA